MFKLNNSSILNYIDLKESISDYSLYDLDVDDPNRPQAGPSSITLEAQMIQAQAYKRPRVGSDPVLSASLPPLSRLESDARLEARRRREKQLEENRRLRLEYEKKKELERQKRIQKRRARSPSSTDTNAEQNEEEEGANKDSNESIQDTDDHGKFNNFPESSRPKDGWIRKSSSELEMELNDVEGELRAGMEERLEGLPSQESRRSMIRRAEKKSGEWERIRGITTTERGDEAGGEDDGRSNRSRKSSSSQQSQQEGGPYPQLSFIDGHGHASHSRSRSSTTTSSAAVNSLDAITTAISGRTSGSSDSIPSATTPSRNTRRLSLFGGRLSFPSPSPSSQFHTSGRALNDKIEPFELFKAIEKKDVMTIMEVRDRDFGMLVKKQGSGGGGELPLVHSMRIGKGHRDIAILITGAISKQVNVIADEPPTPKTKELLRAIRTNLKIAINFGLETNMTDLISGYLQVAMMSEGDAWILKTVQDVSLALRAGSKEGKPVQTSENKVKSFATRELDKADMIASVQEFISNATADLLLLGLWSIITDTLPSLPSIPTFAFGRDTRVFQLFLEGWEAIEDKDKKKLKKWVAAQAIGMLKILEQRNISFSSKVRKLGDLLDH